MENYISIRRLANQRRRRLVAFFLIFASAFFAFRLMRSDPPKRSALSPPPSLPRADTTLAALLKNGSQEEGPQENITAEVIQKYQEEVYRLNEDKKGRTAVSASEITTPPDEFLEGLIAERASTGGLPITLFFAKDIRVVSSPPENLATYAREYKSVLSGASADASSPYLTAVYEALLEARPAGLRLHTREASRLTEELLKISVPEQFLAFHLEMLNLWQRRAHIGTALLNTQDPVGQALALDALSKALQEEERVLAFLKNIPKAH